MSKGFLGIIAAVIIVFVGIIAFSGKSSSPSNSSGGNSSNLSQHKTGKGTTGVKLTEYGDFQCPYCEQYYPTVKQAVAQFGDQITFQFRNFPLTSLHANAFAAARAAEAAGLQNKYWEMHDALYEPQNWAVWTKATNPNPEFERLAQQLGLNVTQFKTDFKSSKVNDIVNADMAAGTKLGITGTPTFYLDGKKTDFSNDVSDFTKKIQLAGAA